MKKILASLVILAVVLAGAFASGQSEDNNVIRVGATPEPHAEMLNLVIDDLAEAGYKLEVVEFTDYVTPNEALQSGEIDANFFQHIPYLNSFINDKGYKLANAGGIHIEPIALYSKKYKSVADIPNGATVAIPNDPTNGGRALLLLEAAGLFTLREGAGLEATEFDIADNPKNIKVVPIEAASLPRTLADVDAAVINGNYAIPAGLVATRDGLYIEGADSPYVNVVASRAGEENSEKIVALVKALQSDEVKNWVAENYKNGEVVTVF